SRVGRGSDQILQHLAVLQCIGIIGQTHLQHLHAAVDPNLYHVTAGRPFGGDFAELGLKLLRLLFQLGELPKNARELTDLSEHYETSSPSASGGAAGTGCDCASPN